MNVMLIIVVALVGIYHVGSALIKQYKEKNGA
jgi:hypothetical protein